MIKVNQEEIKVGYFPDQTLLLKHRTKGNIEVNKIYWYFENNEELIAVYFLSKHLREHGVRKLDLVMPYIPNARQDRVKREEDIFTLKYFSEMLNGMGFDHVYVLDPHSDVACALIDRVKKLPVAPYIEEAIRRSGINKEKDIIFYPDSGSQKRYAEMILFPNAFGIKRRDWESGEIKGLDVAGESPKKPFNVLIVDDISSFGGTFYFSAKKLKELGAEKIYLYVTHCENSILEGKLIESGLVDEIYTTDSIFTKEHELIKVITLDL